MFDNYIAANKIFFHPDRIDAYLNGGIVKPISVKMRLTDACNAKCFYCSYKNNLNSGEISLEDALTVFARLKHMGVKSIVFTGGEPTCHDMFKQIVKAAKEIYNFDLGLITNGIIYPDALKYLTWVRFSLDTVDSEIYRNSRGVDSLDAVMQNINDVILERNSVAPELTVGIQAIVNRCNFDYKFDKIIDVIKFAANVKADYFQIRPLENIKYGKDESFIISGLLEGLKKVDYGVKILYTKYKWDEVQNNYEKDYDGCPSADFMGSVDAKGDFYICCAKINDETAKYGNLIKDKADDILNNRKIVQQEFDYSKCTIACQGSLFNKVLNELKNVKHRNFI